MGAMRLCFLLFCLSVSVSSVRKINDIISLRDVAYGRAPPRHGFSILFWFVQNVIVDQNSRISCNFDPTGGAYGFHWFENRERLLPSLSSRQSYYSVGNLNYPGAYLLPMYAQRYRNNNLPESNMDRLMISLFENNPYRISRVFITAHNRNRNDFNPSETYEIDPGLILQIRQTSCNVYTPEEIRHAQFLQQIGYNSNFCGYYHRNKRSSDSQCNTYEEIKLEIKTTTQGYSKLIWENIPADLMKQYSSVYIAIRHTSDTNKDCKVMEEFKITESSGAIDTSVSLNAGLQPRMQLNYFSSKEEIWYGPEFDGANVIPIRIKGLDASLQLYAKDGKACARLYIKKTFSNWKDVLHNSWIGFYKSSKDKNDGYSTYCYATNFQKIDNKEIYDIYQYNSSLAIAPGVQIRFLMDKEYNKVLAQTTPWEGVKKVTSSCDNPLPDLSSSWSYPEFFYQPEFYDANNVIPIKIPMYGAGLQLFTKDGIACARLYIKKNFTDWKNTFSYSWVGFYTSSKNANDKYDAYQYAVNFEKMKDGTNNFDVYQFKSNLAIAPGVQIRFLKDKGYYNKLVETEAWY